MNKKTLTYAAACIPLVAANGLCLAAGYMEAGNLQVNVNILAIFLIVSALIAVSKLFFDFFVTVVAARVKQVELPGGDILDVLMRSMLPQWIVTLAGLLLSHVLFPACSAALSLINFAVAHTVYYACVAVGIRKRTAQKVFGWVYGAVALVCWGYAIYNLVAICQG